MAEQTKPTPQYHFAWSGITPSDLGLQAGYWKDDAKDSVEFREIIGWVTMVSREQRPEAAPENGFHAVVLDYTMYPQLARLLPRYCGVFLKRLSDVEARALAVEWAKPKADHTQPNIKGVGVA